MKKTVLVGYIVSLLVAAACSLSVEQPEAEQYVAQKYTSGTVNVLVENTSGGMTNTLPLKLNVPEERLLAIPETMSVRGLGLIFFTDAGAKAECNLIFGGIPLSGPSIIFEPVPGFPRDRKADARNAGFPDLNCVQLSPEITNCSFPRLKEVFPVSTDILVKSFKLQGELQPYIQVSLYVGVEQHMDCRYPRFEIGKLDQFEAKIINELASWNPR